MNAVFFSLITLTAIGGIYLASQLWQHKNLPLSAAHIHGFLATLLLSFVAYRSYFMNSPQSWIALGVLVLTALGGLYLVTNHKKGNPGPRSAILIHAFFGLTAIILILISII